MFRFHSRATAGSPEVTPPAQADSRGKMAVIVSPQKSVVFPGMLLLVPFKKPIVHIVKSLHDLLADAKLAEENDDIPEAVKLYERAVKQAPTDERAYNRLMILYRKEKDHDAELKIIDKGIDAFTKLYQAKSKKVVGNDKEAVRLSNALIKSLGLKDKKGNDLVEHEPIATWKKRKAVVLKKIK
jgi:tetratricopeptide (TPR) repeat protein